MKWQNNHRNNAPIWDHRITLSRLSGWYGAGQREKGYLERVKRGSGKPI
jgi:hypothetical protein